MLERAIAQLPALEGDRGGMRHEPGEGPQVERQIHSVATTDEVCWNLPSARRGGNKAVSRAALQGSRFEMKTQFETLALTSPAPQVTVVTMNRPAAMNSMNTRMMEELRDCFSEIYVEPDVARCLILTGAGDRAFCAGADLKERNGMTDAAWRRQHAVVEQIIRAMLDCPLPIIAAVNGAAFAGGCELAMPATSSTPPITPALPRPRWRWGSFLVRWGRRTCPAPSAYAAQRN